jgi:hypothetical protein
MNTPTTINDGGPAFPVHDVYHPNGEIEYGKPGMSLRAYFAGQALAGEIAAATSSRDFCRATMDAAERHNHSVETHIAIQCVRYADALIAELNKTQQ